MHVVTGVLTDTDSIEPGYFVTDKRSLCVKTTKFQQMLESELVI